MPKISVIMPFYNCEKYLDESIGSILNQTFSDFEFIIINDASIDNSDEIVKKYLQDKRIIYIKNEKNQGIVKNLNYGISLAKGEYIARMDGDDISDISRFQKQIDFLENNENIAIVSNYVYVINENNKKIGQIIKPTNSEIIKNDLFNYLTIVHGSALIRKEVYNIIGNYRQEYLYTEDTDWTYRLIFAGFHGANISDFLYFYRKYLNSSSKNSKEIAKKNFQLRKEMIKKFELKIGLKGYIFMYVHYILGMILTGKQKEKLESFIKKIISKEGKK